MKRTVLGAVLGILLTVSSAGATDIAGLRKTGETSFGMYIAGVTHALTRMRVMSCPEPGVSPGMVVAVLNAQPRLYEEKEEVVAVGNILYNRFGCTLNEEILKTKPGA